MKKLYILSIIIILFITLSKTALAQDANEICTVTTDSKTYTPNETIIVTGNTNKLRAMWFAEFIHISNPKVKKEITNCRGDCTNANELMTKGYKIKASELINWAGKRGKFQVFIEQDGKLGKVPKGMYKRCKANFCITDPTKASEPNCDPFSDETVDVGICDSCNWCDINRDGLRDSKDPKPSYWDTCNNCVTGQTLKDGSVLVPGTWTALGCIPNNTDKFVYWLLSTAIGIGGGIAFLFMIFGAFQITLSGGDPEKLNAGKEVITSAIAGLLMIIFSVLLLKIIGYDILRIPGITIQNKL